MKVGGREVHLANKEFTLLKALAAEPHRVFTKERAPAGRLGIPFDGTDAHAGLAREPASAQARSGWIALRLQLLGRRLQAAGGVITPGHKRALNRALHELRRPLQTLLLLEDGNGRPAAAPPRASRRGLLELATCALQDLDGALNGGSPSRPFRRFSCREARDGLPGALATPGGRAWVASVSTGMPGRR